MVDRYLDDDGPENAQTRAEARRRLLTRAFRFDHTILQGARKPYPRTFGPSRGQVLRKLNYFSTFLYVSLLPLLHRRTVDRSMIVRGTRNAGLTATRAGRFFYFCQITGRDRECSLSNWVFQRVRSSGNERSSFAARPCSRYTYLL